nr:MAG TPA: hypothetical protein [Caudoviricetes sp.]
MKEAISFSWEVIKLSIMAPIAVFLMLVAISSIIGMIIHTIRKVKEALGKNEENIKDRFDEARKKDTEIMLKRQGLWQKYGGYTYDRNGIDAESFTKEEGDRR